MVAAYLVMEHVEGKALNTFPGVVRFWKQYVDNVCYGLCKEDVSSFLHHLNDIEPSIQFTYEMENDCSLPFLDIQLEHNSDGTISTSVYRKPTHTDRYLDFSSHHPLTHKMSVIKTFFSRAHSLSSSATDKQEEHKKISKALDSNNYPGKFVDRVYRRVPRAPATDQQINNSIVIPYVRGLSEAIQRVFSAVKVRVLFHPHSTLCQQLVHVIRKSSGPSTDP